MELLSRQMVKEVSQKCLALGLCEDEDPFDLWEGDC